VGKFDAKSVGFPNQHQTPLISRCGGSVFGRLKSWHYS